MIGPPEDFFRSVVEVLGGQVCALALRRAELRQRARRIQERPDRDHGGLS
jgi:hypothetical protein